MSELGMGVVTTYLYVRVKHGSGEDVPLFSELSMGVVRTYLYVRVKHGSGEEVHLCQS